MAVCVVAEFRCAFARYSSILSCSRVGVDHVGAPAMLPSGQTTGSLSNDLSHSATSPAGVEDASAIERRSETRISGCRLPLSAALCRPSEARAFGRVRSCSASIRHTWSVGLDTIIGGVIGGVVSAALIAAVTFAWRWYRRPILRASVFTMANHWVSSRMGGIHLQIENIGRSPAQGVELEVTVPERLYPREPNNRVPITRIEQARDGSNLYVFVAHRDDPLHPAPRQTLLELQIAYNEGDERPTGTIELPVAVRASNAKTERRTLAIELP